MKGEWCYFKNYFTPQQCAQILTAASTLPEQDAHVGVGSNALGVDDNIRRSKVRWALTGNPDFEWLFDALWKTGIQANRDFFGFHLNKLDYLQIAEYHESYKGEYKTHHDVFWMNGDPDHHRKMSAIIQLSDPADYEGGEFEITAANAAMPANEINTQGTIIFFPSFLEHRAMPVTKGVRYSVAAWFDGPKWR